MATTPNDSSPPLSAQITQSTRHPNYYIEGGDLFILVKDELTMFCVHRHFLERENKAFLAKDANGGARPSSGDAKDPWIVSNVSSKDLESLLWVFYDEDYRRSNDDIDHWLSILRLSFRFGFKKVATFAYEEIKKIDGTRPLVERIVHYEKAGCPPAILIPLFTKLCNRDETISLDEEKALGPSRTLSIFRVREQLRSVNGKSPIPVAVPPSDVHSLVASILGVQVPKQNGAPTNGSAMASPTIPPSTGSGSTFANGKPGAWGPK